MRITLRKTVRNAVRKTAVPNLAAMAVLVAMLPGAGAAALQRGDDASRASKNGKTVAAIGDTQVTVDYGRPKAKGRELFGALVPYGEVWSPGANEATELHFSTAVVIDNQLVAAGSYTLWAAPGKEEWTLIINKQTGVWHTRHDPKRDLFRFTVKPQKAGHLEALTFLFTDVTQSSARLVLRWGDTAVPFEISVPVIEITTQ